MAEDVDLSAVPLDELQREFVESAHALAALSDRRALLDAEIQRRQKQATARARIQAMPEAERAALRAALNEGQAAPAEGADAPAEAKP